jgi:hypothetical protein
MNALLWIAVGAAAGVAAGLVLVRGGMFSSRRKRGGPGSHGAPVPQPWTANSSGGAVRVRLAAEDLAVLHEDIQKLHVVRTDLHRVGDLLERLLEEAVDFRRTQSPRPEPAAESARRDTSPHLSPIPGAAPRREDRAPALRVQQDPGFDPNTHTPAAADIAWSAPAAAEPAGPPPGAVHVEASNDIVVASERHPPEAWLERTSGGAEVYLNPRVPLTDPALQRWSTFFDWERREPGARYQASRPAVVSASGSVVRKGMARPS